MSDVLLVQLDGDVAQRLRGAPIGRDVVLDEAESVDAAVARLQERPERWDAAVLGAPAEGDPMQPVARLQRAAPGTPVVVVTDPERTEDLSRALRFAPPLGAEVRWANRRDVGAVCRVVGEVVERTRRARRLRSTVGALNDRLLHAKPPERAVAVYLGRLLSVAPIGVVETDAGGRVSSVNPRAAQIVGHPEVECVGREIGELVPGVDAAQLEELAARCAVGGAPPILERPLDGQYLEVLVAALPAEGRAPGFLVLLQDVTRRVTLERSLRQAEKAKDEFLSMLAHELRNPLAPMLTAVQLMNMRQATPEATTRARAIIERQLQHLSRLVDDLLDVSRLARGKIELRRAPVDVLALAREVVDDHLPTFESREIALSLRAPTEPVVVDADRTRLRQVLGNLLGNALKFTPAGGRVELLVETEASWAVLVLSDTGRGMTPELLEMLFEPFAQGDTSLDRSQGGLGLGLAVSRGLVELHGGQLTATSPGPGQGSTFTARLPLAPRAAADDAPASATSAPAARRVLVVEDNIDAAESLRDLLRLLGHEVEVVTSGAAVLEAARSFRPDLVLCDVGLPELDGYAVARALRADPSLAHVRLIAVTGYGRAEDRRRARDAGFDDHVVKPLTLEALTRILAPERR